MRRQAASAWALRDTPGRAEAALQHARQAIEIATGWCAEQPRQCQPRAQLAAALSQLAFLQNYREDFAGSTVNFRAAIASHDDMVARFPTDATRRSGLARELFAYAGVLLDRFRQCDLDEASTCAARAVAVEAQLVAAGQPPLRPGWRSLALCAVIERARERGQVDAACGALAHALAEDPPATTGNGSSGS